jgi:NAD+ synthase
MTLPAKPHRLCIALAQLNPVVGDIETNLKKLSRARADAAAKGADLVVATELIVSGYPPEDLVLKAAFNATLERAVKTLARKTVDGGPGVILGAPWRESGRLSNAALLLDAGRIAAVSRKRELPSYGVFDETRLFCLGSESQPMNFRGVELGVMICEDMWHPRVSKALAASGAELLVVINGSPFEHEKERQRLEVARKRIKESGLPLIYVNQVGGQDELVFDGVSFAINSDCDVAVRALAWGEAVVITEWERSNSRAWRCRPGEVAPLAEGLEAAYGALTLGIRDYVDKNGFPGVLVGLSGGIDSALTAVLATDALGAERVRCVSMPSKYTAQASVRDTQDVAKTLGVRLKTIPIESLVVEFATIYGDMCGGFNALKDVYKTTVYDLARWRNEVRPMGALGPAGCVIPERILSKPPSAELKADQTDQEILPPYDELDEILKCLVEEDMGVDEAVDRGLDRQTVRKVWHMLQAAEYKRRQAPPGVKITRHAFGRDRRYPITNRYDD